MTVLDVTPFIVLVSGLLAVCVLLFCHRYTCVWVILCVCAWTCYHVSVCVFPNALDE